MEHVMLFPDEQLNNNRIIKNTFYENSNKNVCEMKHEILRYVA